MRSPTPLPAPRTRRAAAVALTLAIAGLAGCGGGGSSTSSTTTTGTTTTGGLGTGSLPPGSSTGGAPAPANTVAGDTLSVGPGCFTYTLTASPVLTGTDPLLAQQWHLRNVGTNTGAAGGTPNEDLNVFPAWAETRGAGARVVVIDDAIEVTHPDLRPNLVANASRSYRAGNPGITWPLPCTVTGDSESHGTSVAGLLLARDDNGIGGAGVAPRASLVAFDALASGLESDIADALQRDGALNAIYHNSWGSPDDAKLHASDAAFRTAIRQGIDAGRAGKGAVYVFSAGNGRTANDNSNYDGYVNRLGTNAICAVDNGGRQAPYSESGANLLVCAPSSGIVSNVTTTTLNAGYRTDFSGTSASAPMASGVAALVLAAKPDLTWRDVRLILAQSARQNDAADPSWLTTGSGKPFSHRYGFGVADANAAVALAKTWSTVGGSASLVKCEVSSGAINVPIADATGTAQSPIDGTPATSALSVTGCGITAIEYVEVTLTVGAGLQAGSYSGDWKIELTHTPTVGGPTTSTLAEQRVCTRTGSYDACGPYSGWTFGSNRHLGEAGNGTWTLTLTDRNRVDDGTLTNWSVTLYGR